MARESNNYADTLVIVERFEEARSLMRKMMPIARRVLGENHEVTLLMRNVYARALHNDPGATLDDFREAVSTLEETARLSKRVLGNLHPATAGIENELRNSRAALRARETPSPPGSA